MRAGGIAPRRPTARVAATYPAAATPRAALQSASARRLASGMPWATSASKRSRSATIVGGRRSRSDHRWRSRARATAWNVPASTWSRTPDRRSRRRSSPAASRVKVRARVWRASAVPIAMRWAMRRVSTRVLPEPAPAMTATSLDGVVTAATCIGVRSPRRLADGAGRSGSAAGPTPATLRVPGIIVRPMPYPTKLLNDNESVVLDLHPHWWYFVEAAVALVVTVVLGIVALVMDWPSAAKWVCLVLIVASAIWLLVRYVNWLTTNFVVTTDRVIFRHGTFAKAGIEIPLERVNSVHFGQSFLERILGAG